MYEDEPEIFIPLSFILTWTILRTMSQDNKKVDESSIM